MISDGGIVVNLLVGAPAYVVTGLRVRAWGLGLRA